MDVKPENLKCPECGAGMISRANRATGQRFWGCVQYPGCKGTRDTDGRSRAERDRDIDRDQERQLRDYVNRPRWQRD